MPSVENPAPTLWLTGLPCSGKTTLAREMAAVLRTLRRRVEILDGDEVRTWLTPGLGFSREDRFENISRVARVCALLNRHGVTAIAALVSPHQAARSEARRICGADFVEVWVRCPPEVCAARDVKGQWARAKRGEIRGFTGVDDPYEDPTAPDVTIASDQETPTASAARVVEELRRRGGC